MTILALTQENFAEVTEKNEIVLIDFWAEWCQPCHSFSKIFEKVASNNTDIVFGNVNVETQPELTTEFNVQSIPFLVVMRRKVVLYSGSGELPEKAVQDLIEQAKNLDMEFVLKKLHYNEAE
jgi:thioredoxin 1